MSRPPASQAYWPANFHETVVALTTVAPELRHVRSNAPVNISGVVNVVVPVPSQASSEESNVAFTW